MEMLEIIFWLVVIVLVVQFLDSLLNSVLIYSQNQEIDKIKKTVAALAEKQDIKLID